MIFDQEKEKMIFDKKKEKMILIIQKNTIIGRSEGWKSKEDDMHFIK